MTDKITDTTSKKQKFVGVKQMLDPDTGELIPMQITQVEYKDFNFHKVWLEHFVHSLDEITNKKLKLAFWIIDNLDYENKLIMTLRNIAIKSGISYRTVVETMGALQKGNPPFLKKIQSGAYIVNPNILWKGSHTNRMGMLFEYTTPETNQETTQEQLMLDEVQNIQPEKKIAPKGSQSSTNEKQKQPSPRKRSRQEKKAKNVGSRNAKHLNGARSKNNAKKNSNDGAKIAG